jgi:tetratricopeptide (TPR) repeat protein
MWRSGVDALIRGSEVWCVSVLRPSDTRWAEWLHEHLDTSLGRPAPGNSPVPNALQPIYREREDFSDAAVAALDASAALIVLCSASSAGRPGINEVARAFRIRHPDRPVIPVLLDGNSPERVPPALRCELAADGTVTDRLADVPAVELRDNGYVKDLAVHQIVARLVGLSPEELSEWLGRNNLLWMAQTHREEIASLERQANADPGNIRLQDDLSRAHQRFAEGIKDVVPGDQGYLQAALESFRASLAIRERLVKEDPGNADWQRDLFIAHSRVGDVLENQGKLAAALASHRTALPVAESLAKSRPRYVRSQLDVYFAYASVATMEARMGERGRALDAFKAARAVMARLASAVPDELNWTDYLDWVDGEIAKLKDPPR